MRKYKQVKRKEVIFSLEEWKQIEEKAASLSLKTGTFVKRMALDGQITYYNLEKAAPVMNAWRIIGGNINQIAKNANENNIYAGDIEELKKEYNEICHTLNRFLSTLPSNAA